MNQYKGKKILALLTAALLSLSLAACGGTAANAGEAAVQQAEGSTGGNAALSEEGASTDTVVIVHEYGETQVPVNPEKIIVFDLGILDILDSVGVEIGGVPSGVRPAHLSQYTADSYLNAGSMKEADFEAINEYGPDVILITGRLAASYEELSKIAPTVYFTMPSSEYLEDFRVNIEVLSRIFPAQADEMNAKLAELDDAVADLYSQAQESGMTALVAMANDNALSFFGSGSRYGVIHDSFGFVEADDDIEASTHGQESTFEYIREINPDVLFVIDRSAAIGADGSPGAAALLDNELVAQTNAAQNGKIIYLSSDIWYLAAGGFQSSAIMVEEVAAALA